MKSLFTTSILAALAACSLTGCETMHSMENRIVRTAAGDEVHVMSKYGPWGITSRISDKDRDALFPVVVPAVVAPAVAASGVSK